MSLKYAICGFLNYRPVSGYDLNRIFNRSVAYFWPSTQSQVYRTLEQLESEGWVEGTIKKQDGRPDRKVYRLTKLGLKEFVKWLKTYSSQRRERTPWMVHVFFAALLNNQEIIALLENETAEHQARLAFFQGELRSLTERDIARTGWHRDGTFWHLTLDLGVKLEEAWLEWLEHATEQVKRLPSEDEVASARSRSNSPKSLSIRQARKR